MNHTNEKYDVIILALERISQAFRSMLWEYGKKKKLSPIQIQFLIFIATHPQQSSCVSEISRKFSLTQATVSEAINTLVKKAFIKREKNEKDQRQMLLSLTSSGKYTVKTLLGWQTKIREKVREFPDEINDVVSRFLIELIEFLYQENILPEVNSCYSCFYLSDRTSSDHKAVPRCVLGETSLSELGYKIDCNNFIKKELIN